MRRINLLAASALVLALAAPAYSQSAAPGDANEKPTQLERSVPADNPAADTGSTEKGSAEMGKGSSDKSSSDMDKSASDKSKSLPADKATTQTGGIITQQATSQKLADNLIGMRVENPNKENVGKISDLILDDQNRIVGAVLSVGGFLGIGDKHVGLAWNEIKVEGTDKERVAVVTLTKDQLKGAPEFKTQADLQAQQEAERRKLEHPTSPSGGALGGSSTGNSR